ncbi:MAG: hypothetical protein GY853_16105 [PVC group bacterium]|nr:hypothetical protein [PVC group bacterium]
MVVGGHTNTFLYNGTPPSGPAVVGNYPEVYRETGHPCLVVQDYAFGKYLGFLHVHFDINGVLTNWAGNPILMDNR